MNTRNRWPLAALALLLVGSGCGGPLVNAKGRLTYKGQPVPSTYVKFWPLEEGQRASTGLTDDNGDFTLRYSRTEEGVLRGQHIVFLEYYVSMEEELREVPPKASKELKAVLAKYGDLKTSPLRCEIKENGQFIEIQLE
ncbi:MAG: DUF4198 domain-containing protein [Gemmataceae bacterium]|nr:DUF4198 domain-containing protein [Gemmataceae bacterium]